MILISLVKADDFTPEGEGDNIKTSANIFILDADNTGGDISLQFGESLSENIKWDNFSSKFELSNSLKINGDLYVTNSYLDKDGENGQFGQVLASTITGTDWVTNTSNPIPFITTEFKQTLSPSTTQTITIEGKNFTPSTTVSITNPIFTGTIDDINIISPTKMEVTITTDTTEDVYDIVLSNNGVVNTSWTSNGTDLLEVKTSTWIDLRSGGDSFTSGNAAGNDIRYQSAMTLNRDTSGMYFTGTNPWSSWVKFESMRWNRGTNKTLQWIFSSPDSNMMIGIGSNATNETATDQYRQAEIEAYFSSSTSLWGLYGNNGTIGATGSQSNSQTITTGTILKIKFEEDGDAGDRFTLYQLPSANPIDWNDESTILTSLIIGGSLNPDESIIMPFIIPTSGGSQRFIALKVE
jgi:hypothetical protein